MSLPVNPRVLEIVTRKPHFQDESKLSASNRRREPRFSLIFPIEVSGFERSGRYFVERTSCCDVGEVSCAFQLRTDIAADCVLAIRSFHWQNSSVLESMPVLFQVVRIEANPTQEGEGGPSMQLVAAVRLHPRSTHH